MAGPYLSGFEEFLEDRETKNFGNRSRSDLFHIDFLEEEYQKLEFENDDDVVKIILVYYTKVAMVGKNKKKSAMDRRRFEKVEDLEYYNDLDKVAIYKKKVKSNKTFVVKYSLSGFPSILGTTCSVTYF